MKTTVVSDSVFSNLFAKIYYNPDEISQPILDMWSSFRLSAIPADLSDDAFIKYQVLASDTIYSISNKFYQSIDYWWLVLIMNDVVNPYTFIEDIIDGTWNGEGNQKIIKIMRPEYLPKIKRDLMILKSIVDAQNKLLAQRGNGAEV